MIAPTLVAILVALALVYVHGAGVRRGQAIERARFERAAEKLRARAPWAPRAPR